MSAGLQGFGEGCGALARGAGIIPPQPHCPKPRWGAAKAQGCRDNSPPLLSVEERKKEESTPSLSYPDFMEDRLALGLDDRSCAFMADLF